MDENEVLDCVGYQHPHLTDGSCIPCPDGAKGKMNFEEPNHPGEGFFQCDACKRREEEAAKAK